MSALGVEDLYVQESTFVELCCCDTRWRKVAFSRACYLEKTFEGMERPALKTGKDENAKKDRRYIMPMVWAVLCRISATSFRSTRSKSVKQCKTICCLR